MLSNSLIIAKEFFKKKYNCRLIIYAYFNLHVNYNCRQIIYAYFINLHACAVKLFIMHIDHHKLYFKKFSL